MLCALGGVVPITRPGVEILACMEATEIPDPVTATTAAPFRMNFGL